MPDDTETPETPDVPDAPEAEDTPDTPEPDDTHDETTEAESDLPEWAQKRLSKVNREAQNLRNRLKEAEPVIAAHKASVEAQKSESQRLQERAETAEKRAALLERTSLVADRASELGLPKKLWKRVTGDSVEDIDADIADLLEGIPAKPTAPITQRPRENLRGGGEPDAEPEETDPAKLAALIPRKTLH